MFSRVSKRDADQLISGWTWDAATVSFSPETVSDSCMRHRVLRCVCGSPRFEISGSPRLAAGEGGHFLRTLRRAWREARAPETEDTSFEMAFEWPLVLFCPRCEHRGDLEFAGLQPARAIASASRPPKENFRCRACRRGEVELGLGLLGDDRTGQVAVEVTARCCSCQFVSRLAGWDDRPSAQEIQLDHLYGRR